MINIYNDLGIEVEKQMYQINKLLDAAETRSMEALMKNKMCTAISGELKVYKEVFSDLVAVRLLECDKEAFDEAYRISEGMDVRGEEIKRRDKTMLALGSRIGWEDGQEKVSGADALLRDYLLECNEWLDRKFRNMEYESRELLDEVRQLYRLFARDDSRNQSSGVYEIYDTILRCIQKMKSDINKEIYRTEHAGNRDMISS